MKQNIKSGDRVKFWTPTTGVEPLLGTVLKSEIRYDNTYATIKPDDSDRLVYLFQGAIYGFEPLDKFVNQWNPQAMGRLKNYRGG